ncbi:unnamed protein product [Paramecium primaurelia]|uniref:Protein kinase domain-containing protein n=1 Tax=Paramecium primaurelia TaxID=5886 RepID=A0A8S1QMY0_PARPR|nr:unnamed protein product [Paramecium primaurelia]
MIINNRYEINTYDRIGQGQFSNVFPCVDRYNLHLNLAAKIIGQPQSNIERSRKEFEIQDSLQIFLNPHILKCYQLCQHEDKLAIIMERCELGDLNKKMKALKAENQRYNAKQIIDFLCQIIDGAYLMYQNKIFHRDIKPQNILLTKDSKNNIVYKIGDFGSARIVEDMRQEGNFTQWHTPVYQSPEIYFKEKFSPQSDIFSFGIVLYELCFLELPFKNQKQEDFFKQLKNNQIQINMNGIQGNEQELDIIKSILVKTIVYEQQNRMDWYGLYLLITNFQQKSQIQGQVALNQNDKYIIAKQHINLLISKQILAKNLMIQFEICYQKKLINISKEIFKLSFTTLACCKYILILSIIAFIHNDYKKLSLNIKNFIPQQRFQELSQSYQQYLTQEDYENIKTNDLDLKQNTYTENMVDHSINLINNIQKNNQNQFQSLLENFILFRSYINNIEMSIDYERFLDLQNEIFQNQLIGQFPLDKMFGDLAILLALWNAYSLSEVYYPQSNFNVIQDQVPQLKIQFNEFEAIQYLQEVLF